MKWRATILIGILFIILSGTALAGWDDYQPTTLSATIAKYDPGCNDPDMPTRYCVVPIQKMRVQTVFLGKIRDIEAKRGTYMKLWNKSMGINPGFVNQFEKEIQVQEGNKTYWLPIQTVLIDPLKKEVGANGQALLFVGFIGANEQDWVFLVNEFQAR